MFDLNDCMGFITNHGAKALSEILEKRLQPYHITRVQWIALYYISITESITQKQLAEKMIVKESSIVHLIDRMEKEGTVYRESQDNNRRIKNLKLTKKGIQIFNDILPVAEKFNLDAINNISEEDLNTFKKVLFQMLNNTQS
ncbi:MAG: MarR family transcriptional regulator [Lachnospiraceae bacterium]|jgi:DNA-binding MarR family transcriptional regulator|nr:MarR family transcriptional regulator [Lachnospiraceae bacterium]